jgi:hypothetical protein
MPGAILDLVAKGEKDQFFLGNPQTTFFSTVFHKKIRCIIQPYRVNFREAVDYGRTSHLIIPRYGDFIGKSYLEIEPEPWLPEIVEDETGNSIRLREIIGESNVFVYDTQTQHAVGFVDAVGHYIIKKLDFWVDGTMVDRHRGEWMDIQSELNTPEDKYAEYCRAVGKYNENTPANIQRNMWPGLDGKLLVPLQFSWAQSFRAPLPIRWMVASEVKIDVEFEVFRKVYYSYYHYGVSPVDVSGGERMYCQYQDNFDPQLIDPRGREFEFVIYSKTDSSRIIHRGRFVAPRKLTIRNATLLANYISIPDEEIAQYFRREHSYLIEQVQYIEAGIRGDDYPIAGGPYLNPINEFVQPIKEIFMITRQIDSCNLNQHTNFYRHTWQEIAYLRQRFIDGGVDTVDLTPEFVENAALFINGYARIPARNSSYFHTLIPYRYHARNTKYPIYCFNFALMPDRMQPSGFINFSLIQRAYLTMGLAGYNPPTIDTGVSGRRWWRDGVLVDGTYSREDYAITLHTYAKNYNFIVINNGRAVLKFLN